jgi:two-component system, NtrC family, response regulator AtoC
LLVTGNGIVSTYELRDELVIGRDPACNVVLDHERLSRRHAVVRRGPPITVQDLDSTNGLRVARDLHRGGAPIAIEVGESFHIGPYSFVVVAQKTGDPPSTTRTGRDPLRVVDPTVGGVPALVKEIAASDVNVLIHGESGAGKEVLAQTLHELSGRSGPLVRINCAALSETLLESELFGHEKGAFTGATTSREGLLEAAAGGTAFLDEIGELPLAVQAKLLRAIETREVIRVGSTRPVTVDVRFVAATNRDLPAEVAAKRFRLDLFYRLDGVSLVIPPLRERRTMVGALALELLRAITAKQGKTAPHPSLATDVLRALEGYHWPGNVRELKAVLERAVLLARGGEIGVKHLTFSAPRASEPPANVPIASASSSGSTPGSSPVLAPAESDSLEFLDEGQRAERASIVKALEQCGGNQTRAAKALGMSRTTLVTKMRVYRVPRPRGGA